MVKFWLAVVLSGVALAATGCTVNLSGEGVLVREERRFTVSGAPELALNTFDGSVQVRSWDRNEILVAVEKRASTEEEAMALEIKATQDGNRITIEAPRPRGDGPVFGYSTAVSFIVSVPRKLTLRVETGDGSIAADDLDGRIELRTGDGSVAADRITGELHVSTGDGSVRAMDLNGRVDLSSGDGSITARGRFQGLRAGSGDGSLTIEADPGSTMDADWEATTGDGSITFRVPGGFNAEVDADSSDGSVSVDGSGTSARAEGGRNEDRQTLQTRLGTGGRTIRLRSGDGSIRLTSR